jgi:hypothetical protein
MVMPIISRPMPGNSRPRDAGSVVPNKGCHRYYLLGVREIAALNRLAAKPLLGMIPPGSSWEIEANRGGDDFQEEISEVA